MKKIVLVGLFLVPIFGFSQETPNEQFPIFSECENTALIQQEACFYNVLQSFFYKNFAVPAELSETDYRGTVTAVFSVDTLGVFKTVYVDAVSESLKKETEKIFSLLPKVKSAVRSGRKYYTQYTLRFSIPLQEPEPYAEKGKRIGENPKLNTKRINNYKELNEFETVEKNYKSFKNPQFKSQLNIPFTHQNYAVFDALLNQVGSNNHTATKPYSYTDVARYYDFDEATKTLNRETNGGWWGRKIWNENMTAVQGENYWFTLNPIFDLRLGNDTDSPIHDTFVNTRGVLFQGGLGSQITFTTSVFESQGRFARYYNQYAESIRPSGGNPAVIPGIGIAKEFKGNGYDFPLAEANLKITPNEFIDLNLGYGRNFIGDGYRSVFQTDGTAPYPFFKMNTTFWKIRYTNTYMWLKDISPAATADGTYASKYMASHYLSYNVSKKLNIGLFESVVWGNTNNRGFDVNFVNPIIFYRVVEFTSSSKRGNAMLGLTGKYKYNNQVNFYAQFLVDEFAMGDVSEFNGSWRNKFAYQIGAKYYDAFRIKNLTLQMEYNQVRPYVYSHSTPLINYAHSNQSMGHIWGANFNEFVSIARYNYGRLFGEVKFIYGLRGFDFNTAFDNYNYGGDIFRNYEENRPFDIGVKAGQGNSTDIFITDITAGYLINPMTNLKVFATMNIRSFQPKYETSSIIRMENTWISIGLRTDLFNWYFDY